MTEQIKPKQCGENAWYIPNQKGFVPKIRGFYWVVDSDLDPRQLRHTGNFCDYALISEKNCFETEQEAIDAARKPNPVFDPTPLTWDELCKIVKLDGLSNIFMLGFSRGQLGEWIDIPKEEHAFTELRKGRLNFEVNKYWRSRESIEAWIDQQKG